MEKVDRLFKQKLLLENKTWFFMQYNMDTYLKE